VATALYTGSFDPPHLGHLDVIEQAVECFEQVVVGVMTNPRKQSGMFTAADRLGLLSEATRHLATVTTTQFDGLTVDLARMVGADVLVRSAHKEARDEFQMAAINYALRAIPTVVFPAAPATAAVSSSIIRTLTLNGRVDAAQALVPPCVARVLAEIAA